MIYEPPGPLDDFGSVNCGTNPWGCRDDSFTALGKTSNFFLDITSSIEDSLRIIVFQQGKRNDGQFTVNER